MTATTEQLLAALAAVRHYAMHDIGCAHAHMRESKGGHWLSVGIGLLPPSRIVHACTCGLDDVLRGIDAMLAGRNVGKPNGSFAFLASEPDLYEANHPERPESSS